MSDIKSPDPAFEDLEEDYEGVCPRCGSGMYLIEDVGGSAGLECSDARCEYTVFLDPGHARSIFDG